MGFFSWNCKHCGKSIRSAYSTCKMDSWMKEVVVLKENGSRIIGEYGGYGDVDGMELDWERAEPCVYHKRCWEEAGKPDYTGPSTHANDQGYFCEFDKSICEGCDNAKCEYHKDYQSKTCPHCERKEEISEYSECPQCGHCDWCCECGYTGDFVRQEATDA